MTTLDQKLKALEFFKDWSNYMLVTTVAALGWVSSKDTLMQYREKSLCQWALGLSSLFAILTLAVIPLVGENINDQTTSIYDVTASFRLLWLWGPEVPIKLKVVCWPQHILFMSGIIVYLVGLKRHVV